MRRFLVLPIMAFCGCVGISNVIDNARTCARIGVVANPELSWPKSAAKLQKAFAFYKDRNVDVIVVLGNLTKDGSMGQYRVLAQAWDSVFRNPVKGIDPNPPRRIFVLGERDRERFKDEFASELGGDVSQHGGEFEVNGFRFRAVCGHPVSDGVPTFYSDGKMALTDELCWYPRKSPNFNAGSISGVEIKSGYEPVPKAKSVAQGLLVTVYSSKIAVSRFDFGDMETVADDWVIPRDSTLGVSKLDDRAPQFWDDVQLRALRGFEANKGPSYRIVWPPVLARHTGVRAHSYEVDVLMAPKDGGQEIVVKRRYVLSPNFYRSENRDVEPVSCRFYESELPSDSKFRFAVTPISSFGVRGRTVTVAP